METRLLIILPFTERLALEVTRFELQASKPSVFEDFVVLLSTSREVTG
jgi:hypothetical protein